MLKLIKDLERDELESFGNLMASSVNYALDGGNMMMHFASMGEVPGPKERAMGYWHWCFWWSFVCSY